MAARSQSLGLRIHPLLESAGESALGNIAVVEGIVCSRTGGKIEFARDIHSLGVKMTIDERSILFAKAVGPENEHRFQLVIAGDAEVSVSSKYRVKASAIDGSAGGRPSSGLVVMHMDDSDKVGVDRHLKCLSDCAATQRGCEGLFPTDAKKADCKTEADACKEKCNTGVGSGSGSGGLFIA